MLRSADLDASRLLTPDPAAIDALRITLAEDAGGQAGAVALLAGGWRDQVTAAAAIAIARVSGSRAPTPLLDALWIAIDSASWVAPQLVAAALLGDPEFEPRAADRLGSPARRPPKTIGALIRAYNRCPTRRMPVVAQLGVHDRTLATEEARIGVRGVDGWLDYFAGSSRAS